MILGVIQQQFKDIVPDAVDWTLITGVPPVTGNIQTITGISQPITLRFQENYAGAGELLASVNVNGAGWVSIVHNDEFIVSNNQTVQFRLDSGISRREYFASISNMSDSGALVDDFTLSPS